MGGTLRSSGGRHLRQRTAIRLRPMGGAVPEPPDQSHLDTTAYHPQSNGLVERTHRQIKDALRARLAGNRWPEHLPWVLFGLRAAPKEDSVVSSAELVFGAPLTLPGQLLTSPETPLEDVIEALRSTQPLATRPLTYAEAAACSEPTSSTCGKAVRCRLCLPCTKDHTRSWTGGRNSSSWGRRPARGHQRG